MSLYAIAHIGKEKRLKCEMRRLSAGTYVYVDIIILHTPNFVDCAKSSAPKPTPPSGMWRWCVPWHTLPLRKSIFTAYSTHPDMTLPPLSRARIGLAYKALLQAVWLHVATAPTITLEEGLGLGVSRHLV